MAIKYSKSSRDSRGDEIIDEIINLLDVVDPDDSKDIRNAILEGMEDYEERKNATDVKRTFSRKKLEQAIGAIESLGTAAFYGSATYNPFDNDPDTKARDERFHNLCRELIAELQHRLDRWPPQLGRTKTRENVQGSPKYYLAVMAVNLVTNYKPTELSQTGDGITNKISELLFERATDKPGTDLSMLHYVRSAVGQFRCAENKKKSR